MYKPEPDEQKKIVTDTTHSRDIEVMPMGILRRRAPGQFDVPQA